MTIRTPGGEQYDFKVDRPRFTIGRSATCDLVLPSIMVSTAHAEFEIDEGNGAVRVTDLDSKNGTFVDDERIAPRIATSVRAGSDVRIANVVLSIRLFAGTDASDSLSLDQSRSLSRTLLRGMLGEAVRSNRARLEVVKGPAAGSRLVLEESVDRALIGHGEEVDLDLREPKLDGEPLVVLLRGHTYRLVPSRAVVVRANRTRLTRTHRLRTGDRIRVLATTIRFIDPLQEAIDELAGHDASDESAALGAVRSGSAAGAAGKAEAPGRGPVEPATLPPTTLERVIYAFSILAFVGAALFLLYVLGFFGR